MEIDVVGMPPDTPDLAMAGSSNSTADTSGLWVPVSGLSAALRALLQAAAQAVSL
jgi:hypothetical protein